MDTVFDEGTAAARPFRIEGRTAFGPGVSDMKGGLLAGLYAVRCLRQAGFEDFERITYVCNPDEEVGSPFSGPTILEKARSGAGSPRGGSLRLVPGERSPPSCPREPDRGGRARRAHPARGPRGARARRRRLPDHRDQERLATIRSIQASLPE